MKQKTIRSILSVAIAYFVLSTSASADTDFQIGATAGASFGNTQAPAAVYETSSFMTGAEASFRITPIFRLGGFWDYNILSARSGQPVPFDKGGVSGPMHLFGLFARVKLDADSSWFLDGKFGYGSRSIGAPPPSSDVGPGVGIAVGYYLFNIAGFTVSPRVGYRILSYNVNTTADFAHKSADLNLLLNYTF